MIRRISFHLAANLLLLLFVFACKEETGFQLEQVREILLQFEEGNLVCKINDIALDDADRFYLADRTCHKVWIVDKDGRWLNQIGEQGQGPGELGGPVSVAIRGDTLAVLEAGNSRISFFKLNGEYLSSIPVSGGHLSGIEIGRNDTLIVSESLGVRHFDFYTISGERITQHLTKKTTPIVLPVQIPGGQMSLSHDGKILFSSIKQYDIVKMNWQGDTLKTFTAKPQGYVPPDLSSRENYMKQASWALVGVPLQVGEIVLNQWFIRHAEKDNPREITWERYVDLFTPQGAPLQLALPAPYLFLCAKEDLLYGIDTTPMESEGGNPSIVVYRLAKI